MMLIYLLLQRVLQGQHLPIPDKCVLCGSRILVDSKIYDEFMPLLIKEVKAMKVGNPAEENTDIGSVISHDHMKKVLSYIDLAKQEEVVKLPPVVEE